MGSAAIAESLKRINVTPDHVDDVYMGCVLSAGLGQAPARQASIGAGIPETIDATTVNKVCGSSLKTLIMASQAIALGDARIVVAGGMENMTRAPYLLDNARQGYRLGHAELLDSVIKDGLWDVYNNFHMGEGGELCAAKYRLTRQEVDDFALESYRRAQDAIATGKCKKEIVPSGSAPHLASRRSGRVGIPEGRHHPLSPVPASGASRRRDPRGRRDARPGDPAGQGRHPLETTTCQQLATDIVVVTVLRAGLSLVDSVLELVPHARVGHVGLRRDEDTARPSKYSSHLPPSIDNSLVLLVDPMLATGGSAIMAIDILKAAGARRIRLLSIVAAPEGVAALAQAHPDVDVYTPALDRELNDKKYILPGLGDFGDRLYGTV